MIENETIKIPVTEDLSTDYIEDYFRKNNLNVLRWAIVGREENEFVLNISVMK